MVALTVGAPGSVAASPPVPSSPFPSVIRSSWWHPKPGVMGPNRPFGSLVALQKPNSRLCANVAVAGRRWSVWCDVTAQFPVESTDGGRRWVVAGPLLANDWVGGSMYYVSRVSAYAARVVAMAGNGVVDTTFDGGRTWYQFATSASMAGLWTMVMVPSKGAARERSPELVMHVADRNPLPTQRAGSAVYVTSNEGRTWTRLRQTLR